MFKTNALDSVGNAYVDEDTGSSTPGTRLEANDQNIKQDELTNAVEESGQTLDAPGVFTNNNQVSKAIQISSIGHIDGLIISNGTDTDHDIDIADGACSFKDGSGNFRSFECLTNTTKQIDVNWAEGDNDGGFPSGLTLAIDTEYNFFIIGKDDGTIDAGFDISITAANLLADATDYDWYRRIGSVFTDGSSNIRNFKFYPGPGLFLFNVSVGDIIDASIVQGVYETGNITAPAGKIVRLSISPEGADEDIGASLRLPDGTMTTTINFFGTTTDASVTVSILNSVVDFPIDNSKQLEYTISTNNPTALSINTLGYYDDRR